MKHFCSFSLWSLRSRLIRVFFLGFFAVPRVVFGGGDALKPMIRSLFGEISQALNEPGEFNLPEGMQQITIPGCSGVRLDPGKFSVTPDVWSQDCGLQTRFQQRQGRGLNPVLAINGAFFTKTAILGQIIIDGKVPGKIKQITGKTPKCFLAIILGSHGSRLVMGESNRRADDLLLMGFSDRDWINSPLGTDERLYSLLGGGGWIIRGGKDVHMEAYQRQNFRFRKVDQDSRHSVLALDSQNRLYVLIFETGANLSKVSEDLRTNPEFKGITEAMFLDGGSSSTLVVQGKYLVPPLYVVDKSRFSSLFVDLRK